jgi:hypothetical protein
MPVQFEVKGSLARLLATEDIIVEHKKVETACFNVHTRCLTLPMWEKASDAVYTMLVLHEISHALWTPNCDWTKDHNIPPQFLNIVEDVRVEKLCKRKYPGSPKSFYAGYKELNDQDFFCIGDEDVSEMNLADRVNLYFKIGNFIPLNFTSQEQEIVDVISNAETFEEALNAAEILYKYCKNEKKQESIEIDINLPENNSTGQGNLPTSDFMQFQNQEDDQSEEDGESNASNPENSEISNNRQNPQSPVEQKSSPTLETPEEEPEVKTMESLEESIRDLVSQGGMENIYVEIPELNLDQIIVPNSTIHTNCMKHWNIYEDKDVMFGEVDKKYKEFKNSAQKEVNYLVKEFECHKAADSYARATTARTGVLDCSKLHTYKYNEDLFKKITTLADGKNHGLIFILDWSGSMTSVMMDTLKQLYNLIWFCRKVSIPFEVYAFTADYPLIKYDENGKATMRQTAYKKREGLLHVTENFSLMNILTSKANGSNLETQMVNIFRIVASFSRGFYISYSIPLGMSLSGTPLNESLIALHQILPKFQKENKLQKVQCVILTDGEGANLTFHREFERKDYDVSYMGTSHIGSNCFLRDRKTGNTYSFNVPYYGATDVLLRNLRDKFPNTNFIGIRILEYGCANFVRQYYQNNDETYNKIMNRWKKEKSFVIKNSGYHTYFGLSSSALAQDSDFEVSDDATKSQIKTAFIKSLKGKKMNKKILGEFIQLIA